MRSEQQLAEQLDRVLALVADKARPLPSLSPENAAEERMRLTRSLERGETPTPHVTTQRIRVDAGVYRLIDEGRSWARECEVGRLYEERFDELELDLTILEAWGEQARVRPLCARRYGRGDEMVQTRLGGIPLARVARRLLDALPPTDSGPRVLPPLSSSSEPSVGQLIQQAALGIGLDPAVRVEPRLSSLAATGERTVFLSQRMFTLREARRLVAHEVFGHLVVAANARAQSLRLLQVGLCGAFADQEGLALYLEAALGLMCSERLRILAARVVATHMLHAGAEYGETAQTLHRDHGLSAESAILTAERAYRGGGVARDAGYLAGFLRVRDAIDRGDVTLDELRRGRVALAHVPVLRELEARGLVRPACYRPSIRQAHSLIYGSDGACIEPHGSSCGPVGLSELMSEA